MNRLLQGSEAELFDGQKRETWLTEDKKAGTYIDSRKNT